MDQEFQIGDKAVVPLQGVGVIKEIEMQSHGLGADLAFYVVKLLDSGVTYMFPIGTADANKVRPVMAEDAITSVYAILRDREKPADKQTWNRRYRDYTKKLATNEPTEIAAVLRDLAVLRLNKSLSFGERKMYDKAHGLLVQEIAAVRDVDEDMIKNEIEALFTEADASAGASTKGKGAKKKKPLLDDDEDAEVED